jgi:hypothetical protein
LFVNKSAAKLHKNPELYNIGIKNSSIFGDFSSFLSNFAEKSKKYNKNIKKQMKICSSQINIVPLQTIFR